MRFYWSSGGLIERSRGHARAWIPGCELAVESIRLMRAYRRGLVSDFQLWRLLSSYWAFAVGDAASIYRALGFVPFSGFPLVREGGASGASR